MGCQVLAHAGVHLRVSWLPRAQPIHIAVIHTESSGDQHRIVDFEIEGLLFRTGYRGYRLLHRVFTGLSVREGNFRFMRARLYTKEYGRSSEVMVR
jgi:hypothetical protein